MLTGNQNLRNLLWLQPTLNHYKVRQLEKLVELGGLNMIVLAGKTPESVRALKNKEQVMLPS